LLLPAALLAQIPQVCNTPLHALQADVQREPGIAVIHSPLDRRTAVASYPDGRRGNPEEFRCELDVLESDVAPMKGVRARSGPEVLDHLQILVRPRTAPLEGHAQCLEFLFHPTTRSSEDDPSVGEAVGGRQ
jgi:hypothetical protein